VTAKTDSRKNGVKRDGKTNPGMFFSVIFQLKK